MTMIEASLVPSVSHFHVQSHDREVTSMSDFVQAGQRPKMFNEHRTTEPRLMFRTFYLLCLASAILTRLMPWRKGAEFGQSRSRRSIFKEASSAASVLVASSFMGL